MMQKVIEEEKIDVLVMSTIARKGSPGFIIGNTAESVVQQSPFELLPMIASLMVHQPMVTLSKINGINQEIREIE